ncbi:hypothetical protein B0H14DRAFT_2559411 [Mycena olivaceomarginata]|nr:hypothetical protein B0H14DRAFT_2559411 [Mycena olivaceomarginata]
MSARVDAIHPKAIIGHYARFEFSDDRAVVLELYKGQCGIAPPPFHRPPPSSDRQALQNSMWRASPAELGLASKLAADTPFRGQALCERLLWRARPSIAQIAPPPNSHLQFAIAALAALFLDLALASVCSPPLIVSFLKRPTGPTACAIIAEIFPIPQLQPPHFFADTRPNIDEKLSLLLVEEEQGALRDSDRVVSINIALGCGLWVMVHSSPRLSLRTGRPVVLAGAFFLFGVRCGAVWVAGHGSRRA